MKIESTSRIYRLISVSYLLVNPRLLTSVLHTRKSFDTWFFVVLDLRLHCIPESHEVCFPDSANAERGQGFYELHWLISHLYFAFSS